MNQFAIYHKEEAFNAFKKHHPCRNYDDFLSEVCRSTFVYQLGKMQAWVITDNYGNKWLQSYNTIVSVKWASSGEFERLGKWSVSTSRQQTRFEREV